MSFENIRGKNLFRWYQFSSSPRVRMSMSPENREAITSLRRNFSLQSTFKCMVVCLENIIRYQIGGMGGTVIIALLVLILKARKLRQ